jgi:hypothetical protein
LRGWLDSGGEILGHSQRTVLVEPAAERFDLTVKLVLRQDLIQLVVKSVTRAADNVFGCDPESLLPFSPLTHRHANMTTKTFLA